MKKVFDVTNDNDLVSILTKEGLAKNKVKTFVRLGYVSVNNTQVLKLPYKTLKGDSIVINTEGYYPIDIVYEDNNYLVVNKESGLLSISTSTEGKHYEDTLYKRVREYLNKKHEKCFIVNRIDKYTSGLVIFVKSVRLKENLQKDWNNIVKERLYIAVVSGAIKKDGIIDNYLYEDKKTFSHSTSFGGKRAITKYKVLKHNKKYTMLDVNILTGRKNQIRVHFSESSHPIVGDKKYGSKDNSIHRLALHHYKISFIDPITNKMLSFSCEVPYVFNTLFNNN